MGSYNEDQEFQDVLDELRSHPEVFSRVEAPVGYEAQLLARLDKKLNKASFWFVMTQGMRKWGWAAGMAGVAFFVFSFLMNSSLQQNQQAALDPMLVKIAHEGGEDLVDRWAAAQGDTLAQRSLASDFSTVVAQVDASHEAHHIVDRMKAESL